MTTKRRVLWSVTPDQTTSNYIKQLAPAIENHGWQVATLSLRELSSTTGQLVHVQWPEHVSRGLSKQATAIKHARALGLLAAMKRRNHKVVLTAHNISPHFASNAFDSWFRSSIIDLAATMVILVPEHEKELRRLGLISPQTSVHVIRHHVDTVADGAKRFGESKSLLVLGLIDPYHRNLEFIDALIARGNTRPVEIVGRAANPTLVDDLNRRAQCHDWLTVRPGFVSSEDLETLLERTAAVVSLQRPVFNSGGPFVALPRNIPAVLSKGAQARDIIDVVGDAWVFEVPQPEDKLDLEAFEQWLAQDRQTPDLSSLSVEDAARKHIEMYELLLQGYER